MKSKMRNWLRSLKWLAIHSALILIYLLLVIGSFYEEFENKTHFWLFILLAYWVFMLATWWDYKYGEEE